MTPQEKLQLLDHLETLSVQVMVQNHILAGLLAAHIKSKDKQGQQEYIELLRDSLLNLYPKEDGEGTAREKTRQLIRELFDKVTDGLNRNEAFPLWLP